MFLIFLFQTNCTDLKPSVPPDLRQKFGCDKAPIENYIVSKMIKSLGGKIFYIENSFKETGSFPDHVEFDTIALMGKVFYQPQFDNFTIDFRFNIPFCYGFCEYDSFDKRWRCRYGY